MSSNLYFSAAELKNFAAQIFINAGPEDSGVVERDLVKANLRGIDSHGVSRIPMYIERRRHGVVNPPPNLTVRKVTTAIAHLDDDNGTGFVSSHRTMDQAIRLANVHTQEGSTHLLSTYEG
jgi:L-2-hydroxycarboxylate dehydrogenase (NAD+)